MEPARAFSLSGGEIEGDITMPYKHPGCHSMANNYMPMKTHMVSTIQVEVPVAVPW